MREVASLRFWQLLKESGTECKFAMTWLACIGVVGIRPMHAANVHVAPPMLVLCDVLWWVCLCLLVLGWVGIRPVHAPNTTGLLHACPTWLQRACQSDCCCSVFRLRNLRACFATVQCSVLRLVGLCLPGRRSGATFTG